MFNDINTHKVIIRLIKIMANKIINNDCIGNFGNLFTKLLVEIN